MADKKEVTEKPTVEGPKPDATKEPNPREQAEKMLQTLESLGIKDEDHIKGLMQTAQKFGPQAQELGELRQLLNEMKAENESLRAMKTQEVTHDYYGDQNNVDLSKLIYETSMKATKDVLNREFIEPQKRMQQQYWSELNEVQSDDDYALAKDVFTEHINSPQVQARIASGQTSVSKEYEKTVRSIYRNYLKQTQDALKGVVKPGDVKVPGVESQSQQPVMPSSNEEKEALKNKIYKARKDGDIQADQAIDLLVKMGLNPNPDDPFFKMG